MEKQFPEAMAVERWGDGESYGCAIVWNASETMSLKPGWYCGYVRFKHDPEVLAEEVEVHGGVTYYERDPDGSVVYGFDCAHYMDFDDPNKKDLNWLKAEVERMRISILGWRVWQDFCLEEGRDPKAMITEEGR